MAVLIVTPYQQFFDSNGDPLNGGKVFTYEAGTNTPKATYTDNTEVTPLTNPVILDSAGRAVIWGTGTYKFVVTDSADNIIRTTDNVAMYSASAGSVIPTANAAGTVDAITADFNPNISLTDGALCIVRSAGPNTVAAPTFSPDTATARTIVKYGAQPLAAGDTGAANYPMLLQYDLTNTRWELLNPVAANADNSIAAAFNGELLRGCTLSNNGSDATNDIDISAGSAASDDGTTLMTLSAITKRLDAAWAVGNNQGGLDTGSIADNTYYVYLINRPDTGVTDVLFSLSATAPTMPANYTKKKLIGAFFRASGAIVANAFNQNGRFTSADQTITSAGTLTIPHGLTVRPQLSSVYLVCVTGEANYTAGDVVQWGLNTTNAVKGMSVVMTTTSIVVRFVSTAAAFNLPDKTTGGDSTLTNANWRVRFHVRTGD